MSEQTMTSSGRDRRGMTLVVAMVVLAILSIMGAYAVTGAVVENRIAGNYKNASIALMNAQAALEYGRSLVADASSHPLERGGLNCENDNDYISYPVNVPQPASFICVEHLKSINVSGSQTQSAVSGAKTQYGINHYYRITGIALFRNDSNQEVGRREVQSVERVFEAK